MCVMAHTCRVREQLAEVGVLLGFQGLNLGWFGGQHRYLLNHLSSSNPRLLTEARSLCQTQSSHYD